SELEKVALGRRTLLKGVGLGGAAMALTGLSGCTADPAPAAADEPAGGVGSGAPSSDVVGEIDAAGVERGLAALPAIIDRYWKQTGVPGVAIAVVYDGKVRYLEGVGTRQEGRPETVDADTVFQLASVSKPISSTVVGAAFTKKLSSIGWDDPVQKVLPGFRLSDPWVNAHVTAADLFAHRSGLPDHSGNLLEDLGYDRGEILSLHRYYPLKRFRDNYDYTNYGLTAGAEAIAQASGIAWEDLAQQVLFEPLGMTSSSFDFADLQQRKNRAAMHTRIDGKWVPNLEANYDPQAPAGSASASLKDMAAWVTMLLAEGKPVMDVKQLQRIWKPATVKPALPEIGAAASFYGLGWNVNYEPTGELRVSHSGAFGRGAATTVTLYPSKGLAFVGLTNGPPVGLPEAIGVEFADHIRYGKSTQEDWVAVIGPYITPPETADQKKYSVPAKDPKPARPAAAYTGRYLNEFYGPLTVSGGDGKLEFTVGPALEKFALRHYSGDEFFFQTTGEDDSGFSGATFTMSGDKAASLLITAWNAEELGTFVRA
ncbi:MAG TPA: serine hydrolase, partial [Microlunatus sp.]|nr:serine hydrolase [Microlunatus sp.]